MAKAVTLKNNNNEEVYPVTDLSLVNGNIPTGRIADGAVTSNKINWTTFKPYWKVLVVSDSNHITVPGGYNFIRIKAFAVMPATDGGRMVINSNNRESGSNCYVNYFGKTNSQATQGVFSQTWAADGSAIAVAYLEATNENKALTYFVDIQTYRIGKKIFNEVSCFTRGNDQNYILKGETVLDSTDGDFDLHFKKGGIFPTEAHWVVEGLEK